ncbi:MAG TPA: hypothetical protein VMI56_11545 [Reyranella sp.]|nr:hypothetical protein [Reyranella sp.]
MLSEQETQDLRAFAATMIPASAKHGVPGADDEKIFADIVKSLDRDLTDVRAALKRLAGIADLPADKRLEKANAFRAEGGPTMIAIARAVLQCYYRDDRVMRSLGQEPRSPFPKGHVVEQGDWSLLDPVKARPPFWRKVN